MATLQIENKILYDVPGLSEKLGVGINTIRTYIRGGKLSAVKVGRKYWVDEKELASLFTVEENKK
jgi:excisionase family DNA binding protein